MPTPTDLVTDLPADFNVFGQAVDNTFVDLKGGTIDQILAKNSNDDMDFTWITNDVGDITAVTVTSPITGGGTSGSVGIAIQDASTAQKGSVQLSDSTSTTSSVLAATPTAVKAAYDLATAAIAKSTVTTAGDIIYRNATVPTRLAIGTAAQVLQVNAGATAPEWTTIAAAVSGLTKIVTANFSASAAVQISNCFTSTYVNYIIVLNALGNSGGGAFYMNWMTGTNTVVNSSIYYGGGWSVKNDATTATITSNGDTKFTLAPTVATGTRQNFTINCSNVGNGSQDGNMSSLGNGSGNGIATFAGIIASSASTTGVQFTGNGNLTGTYTVYGLAK